MPEINGVAHFQLCVSDMERSVAFYEPLLTGMGLVAVIDDREQYFYCVGGRTGVAISPAGPEHREDRFRQGTVGLHHVCFRARNRESVDEIFELAQGLGASIVREPREDGYAPGYYSTLFEDPDGIRIEVNFVPGKGLLKDS